MQLRWKESSLSVHTTMPRKALAVGGVQYVAGVTCLPLWGDGGNETVSPAMSAWRERGASQMTARRVGSTPPPAPLGCLACGAHGHLQL